MHMYCRDDLDSNKSHHFRHLILRYFQPGGIQVLCILESFAKTQKKETNYLGLIKAYTMSSSWP